MLNESCQNAFVGDVDLVVSETSGGTSVFVTLASIGILLNITKKVE
jgi:hypothetical protein